jgi:hypothetical protein
MTQLELFDEIDEEKFALSLTSAQLVSLKLSNPEAHHWIKQVRDAVHQYNSMCKKLKLVLEEKIYRAKYGRGKEHYQLDRFPGW